MKAYNPLSDRIAAAYLGLVGAVQASRQEVFGIVLLPRVKARHPDDQDVVEVLTLRNSTPECSLKESTRGRTVRLASARAAGRRPCFYCWLCPHDLDPAKCPTCRPATKPPASTAAAVEGAVSVGGAA